MTPPTIFHDSTRRVDGEGTKMRYRRNIDCLSTNELHDLREAFAALYALPEGDPNSFRRLAGFHGGPPTSYCRHGAPGFFTWHRAYMQAVENALRTVRCDVTLPYWDWSSGPSNGVPHACRDPTYVNRAGATVPNPLYRGPARNGGLTQRRPDINTTSFADLAASAQAALSASDFASFQSQINGVHGGVHVRTGGDMGSVPTAAFDPLFYFHHANVDRLWAQWQASHPGPLPPAEASSQLEPFNRPFSNQWQTGLDTFSTTAMGYQYRRFCFRLPPIRLWQTLQIDWHHHDPTEIESARLVLAPRHRAEAIEVRAFIDQPSADARTRTVGNPAFAGTAGFMAHAESAFVVKDVAMEAVQVSPRVVQVQAASSTRKALVVGTHGGHSHTEAQEDVAPARSPPAPNGHDHDHDHDHSDDTLPDLHGVDAVELNLTQAFRAGVKDRKVSLKLVALTADGREFRGDEATFDIAKLVVE